MTFSVLPDFLCSRLSSTLAEAEQVVRFAQDRGVPAAAEKMRPRIGVDAGERWVRRRLYPVLAALIACVGLYPERLELCRPNDLKTFARVLNTEAVLPALRPVAEAHLHKLIKPLGFRQGKVAHKPP